MWKLEVAEMYVSGAESGNVIRYDGASGAFLDVFVAAGSGGLRDPIDMTLGPDGALYVGSSGPGQRDVLHKVIRYDSATGAFIDVFVEFDTDSGEEADGNDGYGAARFSFPRGLAFNTEQELLVARARPRDIIRYHGPLATQLQPTVTVASASNSDTQNAPVAGADVVIQTLSTASVTETYTVTVGGVTGSTGPYAVRALLNAAVEDESHGGPSNDGITAPHVPQDIDGSFIVLTGTSARGAVISQSNPLGAVTSYASDDVGQKIRSNRTITSTLSVSDSFLVGDVDIVLDVTHDVLDLHTVLISPSGTRVELDFNHGGPNYTNTRFDDEADKSLHHDEIQPPHTGTFRPLGFLGHFDDENANGTWTLEVTDFSSQFPHPPGRLNSWSLDITESPVTDDFYQFTLSAGESVTLAARSPGDIQLELQDSTGTPLAAGVASTSTANQVIEDFLVPTTGTYFIRARANLEYTLWTTRGAFVDLENNSGEAPWLGEPAQPIQLDAAGNAVVLGGAGEQLMAYWPFDGDANDAFGANDGTAEGGTTFDTGQSGQAADFDGIDSYIDIEGNSGIKDDRTISAWVYLSAANTNLGLPIMTGGIAERGDFFGIAGTAGNCDVGQNELYLDHWDTTCYDSNIAVTPGQWNHVAMVFDGTSLHFYVNGVAGDSIPALAMYDYAVGTYNIGGNTIGGSTTEPFFDGRIDEFALWNRALAPAEITALAAGGPVTGLDTYEILLAAGSYDLSTLTPGDGSGEFENDFDSIVRVYDAAGNLVAMDDNSAADGRNASLSVVAGTAGIHYFQVSSSPSNPTSGEYVLSVAGAPPPAGITVTPTSGLLTTEAGGAATFDVVLDKMPTADVTIALNSSDTDEGTVSPSSLTFTNLNWSTAQTVTVTGADDALVDGDQVFNIVTSAAVSADLEYDGLDAADVEVTNQDDDGVTKFFVADDGDNDTYEYSADGTALSSETWSLDAGNTDPRGATANETGTTVWIVDSDKRVNVYDGDGAFQGSWSAKGGLKKPQGIATDSSDIWIVDTNGDKVLRYGGAVSRTSGNQGASSSFSLDAANPAGITTDGTTIWVVDSGTDRVYSYLAADGSSQGDWPLDSANGSPTGLTIDPSGASNSIWVVDNNADTVYEYDRDTGDLVGNFALSGSNNNPQGIADPPPLLLDELTTTVYENHQLVWAAWDERIVSPLEENVKEVDSVHIDQLVIGPGPVERPAIVMSSDEPTHSFIAIDEAIEQLQEEDLLNDNLADELVFSQ